MGWINATSLGAEVAAREVRWLALLITSWGKVTQQPRESVLSKVYGISRCSLRLSRFGSGKACSALDSRLSKKNAAGHSVRGGHVRSRGENPLSGKLFSCIVGFWWRSFPRPFAPCFATHKADGQPRAVSNAPPVFPFRSQ